MSGEPSADVSPELIAQRFGKGVAQPLLDIFKEELVPAIRESFAGGGALFSSRRGEATANEARTLSRDLMAALERKQGEGDFLRAQLAETALNRQFQATGAAEQFGQRDTFRAGNIFQAGAPGQTQSNLQSQGLLSEFLRTLPGNNPAINQGLNFIGQSHLASYNPQESLNPWVGAGLSGAKIAASYFGGPAGGAAMSGATNSFLGV